MNSKARNLLAALNEWLKEAVSTDPELRQSLRLVLLDLLQESPAETTQQTLSVTDAAVTEQPSSAAPASDVKSTPQTPVPETAAAPDVPLRDMVLRLGDAKLPVRALPGKPIEATDEQVGAMGPQIVSVPQSFATAADAGGAGLDHYQAVTRFRIKAEAARWAVERRHRLSLAAPEDERETVRFRDGELFGQAKSLPNCYLWMMDPRGPALPSDAALEIIAGCYECAAAGTELAQLLDSINPHDDTAPDVFQALAEALSALRHALTGVDRTLEDHDQRDMFIWLREQTAQREVFVPRHMRLADPANPDNWLQVLERIRVLREALEGRRQADVRRRDLLNKARYHAKKLAAASGSVDSDSDWQTLAGTLEQIVAGGVPSSDRELRELILPLIDRLPDLDYGANTREVFNQAEQYLRRIEQEPAHQEQHSQRAASATVEAARGLLLGRSAAIVGGYPREQQRQKLEELLGLSELIWVTVLHHQSPEDELYKLVRRPEISVFFAMTRFRSHQTGPQLRKICREQGKVYIELPAGYGVEQVAHQVMSQASGQLASPAAAFDQARA